jgi:hypothetical protein
MQAAVRRGLSSLPIVLGRLNTQTGRAFCPFSHRSLRAFIDEGNPIAPLG